MVRWDMTTLLNWIVNPKFEVTVTAAVSFYGLDGNKNRLSTTEFFKMWNISNLFFIYIVKKIK